MYFTPEALLNHVFEVLRKPKAPNTKGMQSYDSFHLSDNKKTLKTFLRECGAMISFVMSEKRKVFFTFAQKSILNKIRHITKQSKEAKIEEIQIYYKSIEKSRKRLDTLYHKKLQQTIIISHII
jgi:hypothetical protein